MQIEEDTEPKYQTLLDIPVKDVIKQDCCLNFQIMDQIFKIGREKSTFPMLLGSMVHNYCELKIKNENKDDFSKLDIQEAVEERFSDSLIDIGCYDVQHLSKFKTLTDKVDFLLDDLRKGIKLDTGEKVKVTNLQAEVDLKKNPPACITGRIDILALAEVSKTGKDMVYKELIFDLKTGARNEEDADQVFTYSIVHDSNGMKPGDLIGVVTYLDEVSDSDKIKYEAVYFDREKKDKIIASYFSKIKGKKEYLDKGIGGVFGKLKLEEDRSHVCKYAPLINFIKTAKKDLGQEGKDAVKLSLLIKLLDHLKDLVVVANNGLEIMKIEEAKLAPGLSFDSYDKLFEKHDLNRKVTFELTGLRKEEMLNCERTFKPSVAVTAKSTYEDCMTLKAKGIDNGVAINGSTLMLSLYGLSVEFNETYRNSKIANPPNNWNLSVKLFAPSLQSNARKILNFMETVRAKSLEGFSKDIGATLDHIMKKKEYGN